MQHQPPAPVSARSGLRDLLMPLLALLLAGGMSMGSVLFRQAMETGDHAWPVHPAIAVPHVPGLDAEDHAEARRAQEELLNLHHELRGVQHEVRRAAEEARREAEHAREQARRGLRQIGIWLHAAGKRDTAAC